MKNKTIIALICILCCFYAGSAQKVQGLKGSDFNPAVSSSSGQRTGLDPNKPIGYIPGTSVSTPTQYFIRKGGGKGTPVLLTYKTLKEKLGDNKAALAQFNTEFNDVEDQDKPITHWGKIKSVMEIYKR